MAEEKLDEDDVVHEQQLEVSVPLDVRRLQGNTRCTRCKEASRDCYLERRPGDLHCLTCTSADECHFRRVVIKEAAASAFSWEELSGEHVDGTAANSSIPKKRPHDGDPSQPQHRARNQRPGASAKEWRCLCEAVARDDRCDKYRSQRFDSMIRHVMLTHGTQLFNGKSFEEVYRDESRYYNGDTDEGCERLSLVLFCRLAPGQELDYLTFERGTNGQRRPLPLPELPSIPSQIVSTPYQVGRIPGVNLVPPPDSHLGSLAPTLDSNMNPYISSMISEPASKDRTDVSLSPYASRKVQVPFDVQPSGQNFETENIGVLFNGYDRIWLSISDEHEGPYVAGAERLTERQSSINRRLNYAADKLDIDLTEPPSSDSGYASLPPMGHHAHQSQPAHYKTQPPNTPYDRPPPPPLFSRSETVEELRCTECDQDFNTKSEMSKHMARHNKKFTCDYPGCPRTNDGFATKNDLDRHKGSVHADRSVTRREYRCSVPGCKDPVKIWDRKDNFKAHVRRMHPDEDIEAVVKSSLMRTDPVPFPSTGRWHVTPTARRDSSPSTRSPR